MRALRTHENGPALDVLHLEEAEPLAPGPGQIRIAVQACGLNPADWALCTGLFTGDLPRGIGMEAAGIVDAVGASVTDVQIGDAVFGPVPFTGPTAGAAEYALLDQWFPRPEALAPAATAALPMAVETAHRGLDELGVRRDAAHGLAVLVHGAGTTVGYAAVQIALRYGARVIATAGQTYADALRALGAEVTAYGTGMAERVRELAGGPVDLALDAGPVSDSLPEIVRTVSKPEDALTLSDFSAAATLGVRFQTSDLNKLVWHHHVLGEYAQLAAEGAFTVPVAQVFPLEEWRTAVELSLSGNARGKLVLQIA